MLETPFLMFLALALFWKYLRRGRKDVDDSLPPGSFGLPVIGETFHLALQKVSFFRLRQKLYGRIYKTHLFGKPCIRVTGKQNVRKVTSGENHYVISDYPTSVKKLLGPNSLAMSTDAEHKHRRRQVEQFLSQDFLRKHESAFVITIRSYLRRWMGQDNVEIYKECRSLCFDLATKYLLNLDVSNKLGQELRGLYQKFTDNLFSLPINLPGFGFHQGMQAKKKIQSILKEIAESQTHGLNICPSVLHAYGASCKDGDERSLYDAILELLWNATETMTTSMFSICYFLSRHPEFASKLRQEISQIDDNNNEICDLNKSEAMPFVDCVVKESLRTMPPIGGACRKVLQSFQLDGFTIPKDWSVVFGIRDTHENDNITNPEHFNPERWRTTEKSQLAFFTFGGGSRMCPGKNYALNILKLFASEIVMRCSWELSDKDPELVLLPRPVPKHRLMARFKPAGKC